MQETVRQGIYLHVPFCRGKCVYCGFYSVASLAWKELYLRAVEGEIEARRGELEAKKASSLYVGGGTPSVLSARELDRLVKALEKVATFEEGAERTIEVNPEDVSMESLKAWKEMGFNRLSVGVQSFSDEALKRVGRRHDGRQAVEAVMAAEAAGFEEISVDLIVGLPGEEEEGVRRDAERLVGLPVCHASVYLLGVDAGSVLEVKARKGEVRLATEEVMARCFEWVSERLGRAGFEHYEVSNFARRGRFARHNTGYWKGGHYMGFGPAAHSFDGISRRWNAANVKRYGEAVLSGGAFFEGEVLSDVDRYNEFVMTSLRVTWGASRRVLEGEFGAFFERTREEWEKLVERGLLREEEGWLRPSVAFWLVSDMLLPGLFCA
ncbi:MAG: radical SAM family heme chaperone HemW [Odoribacteraceae bacterium]|jgi:oxygen-independent coproporphyrinogen-3 oxidase|nr:radical SAM family heme chaperone HemW [Odoribacteraceae bacterium]